MEPEKQSTDEQTKDANSTCTLPEGCIMRADTDPNDAEHVDCSKECAARNPACDYEDVKE